MAVTPEGRMFFNYGFKDKDYVVKDGKVVSKLQKDSFGHQKTIWQQYPSQAMLDIVAWDAPASIPAEKPATPLEFTNWVKKLETEVYGPYAVLPNFSIQFISTPAREKFNVSINEIETQIQKMITDDNAVASFEKWRTKLLKVNKLEKVIDEVNAEAKKRGIK
jgi:hypothetical protein